MSDNVLNQLIDDYRNLYLAEKEKRLKFERKINQAMSFVTILKNNIKDYDTKYKEDFLNMLDDIGNILGDKE